MADYHTHTRQPDPTPAEIAAACEIIQSEWSEEERERRRRGLRTERLTTREFADVDGWTPPRVKATVGVPDE